MLCEFLIINMSLLINVSDSYELVCRLGTCKDELRNEKMIYSFFFKFVVVGLILLTVYTKK